MSCAVISLTIDIIQICPSLEHFFPIQEGGVGGGGIYRGIFNFPLKPFFYLQQKLAQKKGGEELVGGKY